MTRTTTPPDPQRQLMIKTKTCQRLLKEVEYYKNEVKENEARLNQMKSQTDQYDEYDVKQFQQVLDESYMMVPDSEGRLRQALLELDGYLKQCRREDSIDLAGEWYDAARMVLENHLPESGDSRHQHDDVALTQVDNIKEGEIF